MPVILHPDEHDAWLNCPAEEALALVREYPASKLNVARTTDLGSRRPTIQMCGIKGAVSAIVRKPTFGDWREALARDRENDSTSTGYI
jgi:Uncharacterized conserved protein